MNRLSFAVIAAAFCGSVAFAGAESGGGGGVVCRDPNTHAVISAELYDLYEGEIKSQLVIQHTSKLSPNDQITKVLTQINAYPWLKTIVLRTAEDIIPRIKFLPNGSALAVAEHMGIGVITRVGCTIEGVGFYNGDDSTLHVSRDVYNAFSNTDKAAFILHEGLYKFDRFGHGATTSKFARELVSAIFATNSTLDFDYTQLDWGVPDYAKRYSPYYPQQFTWTTPVPKGNNPPLNLTVSFNTDVKDSVKFEADCFDVYGGNLDTGNPGGAAAGNGGLVTLSREIPDLPCDVMAVSSSSDGPAHPHSDGDPRQFVLTSGDAKIYDSRLIPATYNFYNFILGIAHANITLPKIPVGTKTKKMTGDL